MRLFFIIVLTIHIFLASIADFPVPWKKQKTASTPSFFKQKQMITIIIIVSV